MPYTIKKNSPVHHCLECGDAFSSGRSDKKFCSDHCRNEYNNRKIRSVRGMRMRVHSILNANYELLNTLLEEGRTSISLLDAKGMGFNADYMTALPVASDRGLCCCYDIAYVMTRLRIKDIRRIPVFAHPPRRRPPQDK